MTYYIVHHFKTTENPHISSLLKTTRRRRRSVCDRMRDWSVTRRRTLTKPSPNKSLEPSLWTNTKARNMSSCSFTRWISLSSARLKSAFSDRYEEFSKLDCEIIGCSVDSSSLTWRGSKPKNEGGLGDIEYPLLSDLKRQAVHAYDVYDEGQR